MDQDLLCLIEPHELLSYLLLEKHPLYRYVGTDGDIHVTCVGHDEFTERMILTLPVPAAFFRGSDLSKQE